MISQKVLEKQMNKLNFYTFWAIVIHIFVQFWYQCFCDFLKFFKGHFLGNENWFLRWSDVKFLRYRLKSYIKDERISDGISDSCRPSKNKFNFCVLQIIDLRDCTTHESKKQSTTKLTTTKNINKINYVSWWLLLSSCNTYLCNTKNVTGLKTKNLFRNILVIFDNIYILINALFHLQIMIFIFYKRQRVSSKLHNGNFYFYK